MTDTGYSSFNTTVDKTNHVLREIERRYGWPKERRAQSYAALRAVLHAIRDRLPVEEGNDFAAQMPMLIRGLYYEGWKPSKVPLKMDREEFLSHIRQEFNYQVEGGAEKLVKNVLGSLSEYVTEGELKDIKLSMPRDLAALVP